jgi:hypothetical protein
VTPKNVEAALDCICICIKGTFVGVTNEQFNYWLMFEFKAVGGKRNMHNLLTCKIHSMNRRARTETSAHVITQQQYDDAENSTK